MKNYEGTNFLISERPNLDHPYPNLDAIKIQKRRHQLHEKTQKLILQ